MQSQKVINKNFYNNLFEESYPNPDLKALTFHGTFKVMQFDKQ